jgi:hypothetical protein
MADDIEPMARAGFYVRNAGGLRLHNVEVTGQSGPAFRLEDVKDVEISASGTRTPAANAPIIELANAWEAFVHGCYAHPGTDVFLSLKGENTHAIVLLGNSLTQAGEAIVRGEDVLSDALWLA